MITYFNGHIKHISETGLVLAAGGVGHLFLCATYVLQKAQEHRRVYPDKPFELWCVSFLKDEVFMCYGFESFETRMLFLLLTSITGVGGRLALNLLSELKPSGLLEVALKKDIKKLQKTDGVGRKMAERLILELSNKKNKMASCIKDLNPLSSTLHLEDQVVQALTQLHYAEDEVRPLVHNLLEKSEHLTLEAALHNTLQALSIQNSKGTKRSVATTKGGQP